MQEVDSEVPVQQRHRGRRGGKGANLERRKKEGGRRGDSQSSDGESLHRGHVAAARPAEDPRALRERRTEGGGRLPPPPLHRHLQADLARLAHRPLRRVLATELASVGGALRQVVPGRGQEVARRHLRLARDRHLAAGQVLRLPGGQL